MIGWLFVPLNNRLLLSVSMGKMLVKPVKDLMQPELMQPECGWDIPYAMSMVGRHSTIEHGTQMGDRLSNCTIAMACCIGAMLPQQ